MKIKIKYRNYNKKYNFTSIITVNQVNIFAFNFFGKTNQKH